MFSPLEKKTFKLLRGHEDETKLTWFAAVEPGGGAGGGAQVVSPPAALPPTTVGVSGCEFPTRCSKGAFLALFLGLESISEDNEQEAGILVRYALAISWSSQYALHSYFFVFFF